MIMIDEFSQKIDHIILYYETLRGKLPDIDRLRRMCTEVAILTTAEIIKSIREEEMIP